MNTKNNHKPTIHIIVIGAIVLLAGIMIGTYNYSRSHVDDRLYWDNEYSDDDEVDKSSTSEQHSDWYNNETNRDDTASEAKEYEKDDSSTTTEQKRRRKPYYPEVDEYDDPLEFYEFHPDDFLDYEDAEEYYYENGGE